MAQHDQLYQRAVYYDIALRRNVQKEIDFIQSVYRHHTGADLRSVLEIGCGPGYHTRALAGRGLHAVGLDLSDGMIELARAHAAAEASRATFLVADMRDFQLETPLDMAICMFDGVDALLSDEDFIAHLRAVGGHLPAGGLYLVDCTHPRICSYQHYGTYRYKGERDGVRVEIVWATNEPRIDPVTGVAEVELEMRINGKNEQRVIRDVAQERCLTAPEIRLLTAMSGVFDVVGWYGDTDLSQPLDQSPRAQRMIAVLQKKDGRRA